MCVVGERCAFKDFYEYGNTENQLLITGSKCCIVIIFITLLTNSIGFCEALMTCYLDLLPGVPVGQPPSLY